ncbi:MAG: SAM-dependent methyltransferase, partial [Dongiaceae bacterium]
RVLKPGGRFLFNAWDSIEQNDFARIVTDALAAYFPDDPPRFLARTPHGYHDPRAIRADLEAAGFSEIEVATIEKTSVAPTPRHPAIAYTQGTPLRNEIVARDAGALDAATDAAARAIAARYGDGPVSGRIQAHVATAVS